MADLDSLDLDAVSVDDVDFDDLSSFGVIDNSCSEPHIRVSTPDVLNALKVVKLIAQGGGRDVSSKSVFFDIDGSKLTLRGTDGDVYFSSELPILNEESLLKESFVVNADTLTILSRGVGSEIIIYKKDNSFYIRLLGGDLILETVELDQSKYIFKDNLVKKSTINSAVIVTALKALSPIASAAITPTERRIVFSKERAMASFLYAISSLEGNFEGFDVKPKDINALKQILKSDEELTFYETDDKADIKRVAIAGAKFKYIFISSETLMGDKHKEAVKTMDTSTGVFVDYVQLSRTIEVASLLQYATGVVTLNYSAEGLILGVNTKKSTDTCSFNLPGDKSQGITPLDTPISIQSKLFLTLLRTFSGKPSVMISIIPDTGVVVHCDSQKSLLYVTN